MRRVTSNFKLTKYVLSQLTDESMCATIMEDLEWRYVQNRNEKGRLAARILHIVRCLIIVFPILLENIIRGLVMLRSYFISALRGLRKRKVYSFINITGLALGITCCLLIFLWIQY